MHTPGQWIGFGGVAAVLLAIIPGLNALPEASALHLPSYLIPLLGKFLCFALIAVAMDLIWGYAGILSLGHGVFFAAGGYAMGMHLMRSIGKEGVYRSELPDFMVFLDWKELPWFWRPFDSLPFTIAAVVVVPALIALLFGWFAFRSRIRGVYFSIITQALTFAMMLMFFRNDTGFGGNNGLTDFKRLAGWPLAHPMTKLYLYMGSAAALLAGYLVCRFVVKSRLGRVLVAIRDSESRVLFAGYSAAPYKLFAWTLSAMLCGVAGAFYTPQVGIINPSELAPANSIEMAIWVAVGGRGSLVGAAIGALVINGMKSYLTAAFPDLWLFALGAVFVLVTMYLPTGLVGLVSRIRTRLRERKLHAASAATPKSPAPPTAGTSGPPAASMTGEAAP
jgi:urea transport system permease protein